eukprot:TRINITY_DN8537_c0_g1_i1.p1 TRINITY_DN8537_c0_g1~~TRINITY_DN8537_c0_g1_i1.p1  ORF type:complete len:669 (-),score=116.82 TRINITY_DN8537_c0_g1_i1:63-2069(-)
MESLSSKCSMCNTSSGPNTPRLNSSCGVDTFCSSCLLKIEQKEKRVVCKECGKETVVPVECEDLNEPLRMQQENSSFKSKTECSCSHPVCFLRSIDDSHTSHDNKFMEKAFEFYRKSLVDKVQSTKDILVTVEVDIKNVKHSLEFLQNEKIAAEKKVRDSVNKIREWLSIRERELIDDINESTTVISNDLMTSHQNLTTLSSKIKQSLDQMKNQLSEIQKLIANNNNSINNNSTSQVLTQLEFLKNTKKYIDAIEPTSNLSHLKRGFINRSSSASKYFFSLDEFDETHIQSCIAHVGKIVVKSSMRDYTTFLSSNVKCKKVYGPRLSLEFESFNSPQFVCIIPKEWFLGEGNMNSNNNHRIRKNSNSDSFSNYYTNNNYDTITTPQMHNNTKQPFTHDDLLVIADTFNHRIILLEKNSGKVKSMIGGIIGLGGIIGNKPGELHYPKGIDVVKCSTAPFIRVIVSDTDNNRIQVFDAETGEYLNQFTHSKYMVYPYGVAVNPTSGQIIVANHGNNTLTVHRGFKTDNQGTSDDKHFGELIKVIGDNDGFRFVSPYAVTINSKGDIIVTSCHKVDVFDSDFNHIKSFGSFGSANGQFNYPIGVGVDQFDNILVSDCFNRRVEIFDSEGIWISSLGKGLKEEFDHLFGITVHNSTNEIFVVDRNSNRIFLF